ncbi:B30.2/SPRY domain-containing protein [Entamoeba marina]
MKVSLHFYSFEDVLNFMMVCKKAEDVIRSLKVNPFFGNYPSLQKFMKHFKISTLQYFKTNTFSPSSCANIKWIRSPLWNDLKEEDEEIARQLLPKVTLLSLYHSLTDPNRSRGNNFFIKEATHFTNLQKIEGAIELLLEFFTNYTEKGEMVYVNFPKRIKIETSKGYAISFNKEFFNQMKQLLSYIPNKGLTTIDVVVYKNPPEEDKDLLKELLQSQRVNYHYRVIGSNQTTLYENCLCCYDGKTFVDGHINGDRFNDVFEKSYTTSCVIRRLSYDKEASIWNIPNCITNIEIDGIRHMEFLFVNNFKTFNANVSMIQQLSIKEINNLNIPFPFINIVKIKVEKSSNCKFILNSSKLEHISLKDVTNCLFVNSIDSVKEIVISKVTNCVLPYITFENRSIHIEDSNNLYFVTNMTKKKNREIVENVRSPLEFMEIGLSDFNKLITDCLLYPSKVDFKTLLTKSSIFKMRTFHPQTNRVKVEGNVIQRIIPQSEKGVDLVVSSKFYVENDNLMYRTFCFISVGCIDSISYEFKENMHVGWNRGSIGYHSDDGALFISDGINSIENYGKAYGEKNGEKNVVGCGYNTITNEVFFTVNGTKLQPKKIDYKNISAAIGLGKFDPITINYGDSPFVFDYYGEMEKYKQELNSKSDDSK